MPQISVTCSPSSWKDCPYLLASFLLWHGTSAAAAEDTAGEPQLLGRRAATIPHERENSESFLSLLILRLSTSTCTSQSTGSSYSRRR